MDPHSLFYAALIALTGGMVSALYPYSQERKATGAKPDWFSLILQSTSAAFAGIIGCLLADWQFTNRSVVLALTGIAAIGGYPLLLSIKDIGLGTLNRYAGVHQIAPISRSDHDQGVSSLNDKRRLDRFTGTNRQTGEFSQQDRRS